MKKVAVIMVSDSDLPVVEKAVRVLEAFGIPSETHVYSAHRTPEEAGTFAAGAREAGFGAVIAAAGMAAHLAGVIAAHTTLPVIAVPLDATLSGMDSLLAMAQMPPGIPVATMGIGKAGAKNAAVFAVRMLALQNAALHEKLLQHAHDMAEQVAAKNRALQM